MIRGAHIILLSAARAYTPIIAVFAFAVLALTPAGAGAGFLAGLAFALALTLHALVFGADAARQVSPPAATRLVLSAGLVLCVACAGAPGFAWSAQVMEAGLFAVTCGASALFLSALFGRAPSLRDEDW